MSTSDLQTLLHDMQQLLTRIERRPVPAPPPTGATPGSLELDAAALSPPYPVGHFSERHHLSPSEAWTAEKLLQKANRLRPITGRNRQERHARRIAGIVSAVRNGRVSSAHWGHSMLAKRGGLALARHAPQVLAQNREGIAARRRARKAGTLRQPQTAFAQWQRSLEAPQRGTFSAANFMAY